MYMCMYVIWKTDAERVITMRALKDQYDLEIGLFEFGIAPHTHRVEFQQNISLVCVCVCMGGGGAHTTHMNGLSESNGDLFT
jgi:hypothetical protein